MKKTTQKELIKNLWIMHDAIADLILSFNSLAVFKGDPTECVDAGLNCINWNIRGFINLLEEKSK